MSKIFSTYIDDDYVEQIEQLKKQQNIDNRALFRDEQRKFKREYYKGIEK